MVTGSIHYGNDGDVAAIVELLNMGYRGERSRKGWTTEADLIQGEVRSNAAQVHQTLHEPESVFLMYRNENQELLGCVNLKKHGERIYLGMFSVNPELQGAGIGGKLLQAAEDHARAEHCSSIYMYVISRREELINWYKRKGYKETGERIPFKEDDLTGKHNFDLEFLVLEKWL